MTNSATFRANFPEFADTSKYPDTTVNYWLGIGVLLLPESRWSTLLDTGLCLFTAHNIALEAQAMKSAATGAIPGLSTGAVSAKAIDKVSVSYDTASGLEKDAGHWNLTIYGTRFIKLARMMGAGGIQV